MRNTGGSLLFVQVTQHIQFLKDLLKVKKVREIIDFTDFPGGDGGIRTLDLTDANRTLSQLSYAPTYIKEN